MFLKEQRQIIVFPQEKGVNLLPKEQLGMFLKEQRFKLPKGTTMFLEEIFFFFFEDMIIPLRKKGLSYSPRNTMFSKEQKHKLPK